MFVYPVIIVSIFQGIAFMLLALYISDGSHYNSARTSSENYFSSK